MAPIGTWLDQRLESESHNQGKHKLMTQKIAGLFLILAFCAFLPAVAGATAYYVDYEAADDTGAGTELDPWQYCPGDPRADGGHTVTVDDSVIFKRGVRYIGDPAGHANWSIDITADTVTFTVASDWGTGDAVIDAGGDADNRPRACFLVDKDGIRIDGGSGKNLRLIGTHIVNGAVTAYVTGAHLNDLTVTYTKIDSVGESGSSEGVGVKITGGTGYGTTNSEISYCVISNCWSYGIKVSGEGTDTIDIVGNDISFTGDGSGNAQINLSSNVGTGVQNVTVHDNTIYSAPGDANGIICNNTNNSIYQNEIYSNGGRGIGLNCNYNTNYSGTIDVYRNYIHDNTLYGIVAENSNTDRYARIWNNLIDTNYPSFYGVNIGTDADSVMFWANTIYQVTGKGLIVQSTADKVELKSNVVHSLAGYAFEIDNTTTVMDYNCLYRADAGAEVYWDNVAKTDRATFFGETGQSEHSVWDSDPQMASPANGQFWLRRASPCRDVSVDPSGALFANDYAGTSRPYGSAWDIGAYERASSVHGDGVSGSTDMTGGSGSTQCQ